MTDLEISKALALAIGWSMTNVMPDPMQPHLQQCWLWTGGAWKKFDYRDWAVIGPIAERYKAFPQWLCITKVWWVYEMPTNRFVEVEADTPQKAIALAVIQGANT